MARISNIASIWNNVKEIDLRPLRQEALNMVKIALVGKPGSGRGSLASQMRRDPSRLEVELQTPILIVNLEDSQQATDADLIILTLDAQAPDFSEEKSLASSWANAGKNLLVFVNRDLPGRGPQAGGPWVDWGQKQVLYGPVDDSQFLLDEFVPVVIEILPDRLLPLGRYFPLFRVPIAHHLISDTSFSNAAYALSTGLAEIIPAFGIPLTVADMVVLSKTQAFLVYKLGLALGLSTRWQDYVTEFSSVLGGGFLWRQLARSLIGMIPAWGIIPKVAIAYAGTYVVGNVVLQWYLTGRHVSRKQIQEMYGQAFALGKKVASGLVSKVPRPRIGRRREKALPASRGKQVCPSCGRRSAKDARFCQYCGYPFDEITLPPEISSPVEAVSEQDITTGAGEQTGETSSDH